MIPENELYARWRQTARAFASELAFYDLASGQRWTFKRLAEEAENLTASASPLVYPREPGPNWILQLLAAWRDGKVTCPVEPERAIPELPPPPSPCVHLKLTSASTGPAKAIAFTASQLAADADNIVSTMGLRPEWPNLGAISLAHSYGFSNLVLPLLLHGIPLVLLPAPLPELLGKAARSFAAVTVAGVPALWRAWAQAEAIPTNLQLAVSAGAPLPLDLESQVYERHGIKIHNFYGSSECGGIAYDRSQTPRQDSAYAGTALDNVQLTLEQSATLVVGGAAVGQTYWPDPQPNLGNRRFATNDLAELSNGQVFLRGRAGHLINMAGRKVAPEIVEQVLRTHPEVRECVVFGVPDEGSDRNETIVACVNAARSLTVSELNQFLSQKLAAWQLPRRWWFTEELQSDPRGKIPRHSWKERFLRRAG